MRQLLRHIAAVIAAVTAAIEKDDPFMRSEKTIEPSKALELARKGMKKYRKTLDRLGKLPKAPKIDYQGFQEKNE
ncbi:hypothetical protein ACFCP7_27575 [Paenibacillus elgii]